MGPSVSKASTKDVANTIQNVVNKSQQNCGQASSAQNIIDIHDIKDVTIKDINQYAKASSQCWASNVTKAELRGDIAKALTQLAQAKGSVLGGLVSGGWLTLAISDVQNITNTVNNNFNVNEQQCADALASNLIRIYNVEGSVIKDVDQIAKDAVKCVFTNENTDDLLEQLAINVNNTAKTSQVSLWAILLIIAIVVIALIIGVIYLLKPGHIDPQLINLAAKAAVVA